MSDLSKIIVIDDIPANIDVWERAIAEKLGSEVISIRISNNNGLVPGINLLEGDGFLGSSLVLLDLGLRQGSTPVCDEAKDLLRKLCDRISAGWTCESDGSLQRQDASGTLSIPSDACDGLALLEVILAANPHKCLVEIVSGRGRNEEVEEFLIAVEQWIKSDLTCESIAIMVGGQMPAQHLIATNLVQKGVDEWKRRFPDFHDDAWVDSAIRKWIGFAKTDETFKHNHIANNQKLYQDFVADLFDIAQPNQLFNDTTGWKAILCIDDTTNPFREWPVSEMDFQQQSYFVAKDNLKLLVQALSGHSKIEVDDQVIFPLVPGLGFLLSLRSLFTELAAEDDAVDASKNICFNHYKRGDSATFRMTIPLNERRIPKFNLGKKWVAKCESDGSRLKDGICGALWNVTLARVPLKSGADLPADETLLQNILAGPGRPVVGVQFAPHYIHLHWS